MKRLVVFCEGRTEQQFCARVLEPHLFPASDGTLHTLAVGAKNHHHIFGLGRHKNYQSVRKFILNGIKHQESPEVYFTTLFDLYGLPDDFPGKNANVLHAADPTPYVIALEKSFADDIDCHHFVPYLQLYEFETMLFADPDKFLFAFENCEHQIQTLKDIAASKVTIEHINDGTTTAPSKRIKAIIAEYEGRKASVGPDIAQQIGLPTIRAKCPHVHQWLSKLETILW